MNLKKLTTWKWNKRHPPLDDGRRAKTPENVPAISLLFPVVFLICKPETCSALITGAGFSTGWDAGILALHSCYSSFSLFVFPYDFSAHRLGAGVKSPTPAYHHTPSFYDAQEKISHQPDRTGIWYFRPYHSHQEWMGLARRIGLGNLYRCTHTISTRKGGIILLHLKEIRLVQGLSVPQLVERSGLSRRTIQDIEKRGDCKLSISLGASSSGSGFSVGVISTSCPSYTTKS